MSNEYGLNLETGEYKLNPSKPLVLFLNDVPSAVMDYAKVSNQQYKSKILQYSKVTNWEKTIQLLNDYNVSCVVCKVTIDFLLKIASSEFDDVSNRLFAQISTYPNQFFIYESNMINIQKAELSDCPLFELLDDEGLDLKTFWNLSVAEQNDWYRTKNVEKLREKHQMFVNAIDFIQKYNIELIPYTSNAEFSILATAFLENINKNLLFKLYIPNERIWSEQQGKVINLFKDYLNNLFQSNIQLTEKRSRYGNIYELYGELTTNINLNEQFNEFTKFLNSFNDDITYAKNILENTALSNLEVEKLLNRYHKEARRMLLDMRHEYEEKVLRLRHRIESDVDELDIELSNNDKNIISQFIGNFSIGNNFTELANPNIPLLGYGNVDIKLENSQLVQIVNSSVSEVILGNKQINPDFLKLKELIKKYGKDEAIDLDTALAEVQDDSLSIVERKTAASKLKSFLLTKVVDPAWVATLTVLIEKMFE